ncbi:hypothetical protein N7490_007593 [Penicillium lividum]|nr:hypothetical protein N7490_007593 [Penicillium lividum]
MTTLFATSAIAKYSPGQDCRTNKGCDQNCLGSKWSVVIENGDARMVCDPSNLDSTRYATANCVTSGSQVPDDKVTTAACDSVKGKFCNGRCYFTSKASKEEDSTWNFKDLCYKKRPQGSGSYFAFVFVYPTKQQALQFSDGKCDSVFSSKEL